MSDMTPREAVDLVEASIPWKLWAHSPELTAAARVTLDHARAATGHDRSREELPALVDRFTDMLTGRMPCEDRLPLAERMADVALRALGGDTGDRGARWRTGGKNPYTVYRVADGERDEQHARDHFLGSFRHEDDSRRAVDAVNALAAPQITRRAVIEAVREELRALARLDAAMVDVEAVADRLGLTEEDHGG